MSTLLAQPRVKRLLSTDHFSVDGTLIQAWASMKSVKPIAGSDEPPPAGGRTDETDFRGETRSNATHASTSDPEARLYRKGPGMEARLAFLGHALMENRCGLLIDPCLTQANGHAERHAALAMIEKQADRPCAVSLGADKAYDAADFVNELRSMNVRACRAERDAAVWPLGDRWTHHTPPWLRREPAHPQKDRGSVRLDEDNRRHATTDGARYRAGWMGLHLRCRRVQSSETAKAARITSMI